MRTLFPGLRPSRLALWLMVLTVIASGPPPVRAESVAPSRPMRAPYGPIDPEPGLLDCTEAAPATAGVPQPPVLGAKPIELNAYVLADGMPAETAAKDLEPARRAYEKIGIDLKLFIKPHRFEPDGRHPYGDREKETINTDTLMKAAAALFPDHKRPAGYDVVYVLTAKDLWTGQEQTDDHETPEENRDYGVAGMASCIGGVRFPTQAFAVGEWDTGVFFYVTTIAPDFSAAVAAHEIGHLMGAHHHYAVCGITAPAMAQGRSDACTLMFPDVSIAALEFSPTNSAIVYGHADKYARP